ncbi:MAG: MFS transporter [Acidimicrobiales bacterium]
MTVRRRLTMASLRPLRHRDFAIVWTAALVSNVGSWMQIIATGVLITELTGRASWTGLVAAAGFLPIGVLSPIGGAVADRVNRKRWLLITTFGETVFATLMAVATGTGHVSPGVLTLLVFGAGSMLALGIPAFQAILPDLVGRDEILAATSLSLAEYNLGRVVGPALTGVVLALGSYTWAYAINAVSYGAVLIALVLIRLPGPVPTDEQGGVWARIVTGVRAAAADSGCRLAISAIAVTALLISPFIALVPAVAVKLFDNGPTGTSVLITAQGAGAVIGALLLAPLAKRSGRRRLLVGNLVVLPLVVVGYALAPSLAVATVALLLLGMTYVGVLSGLGTVVQLRAPASLRARVLSLYMVALGVIYPIGAVIQGWVGDRFGLRTVTAGTAAVFLAVVLLSRVARPGLAAGFDDVVTAPAEAEGVAPA